jgi:site-specific DNA recombinase
MKAVGYIRVSTNEQANEGVSLDAQRAKIEAYAAFRGLDLIDIVIDAGVSASKPLADRVGGGKLLGLIESGAAGAVVAAKLDRLFRNAADCLVVTRTWDKANVSLHLLDMGMDTTSPLGRAFLTMAAAFGELELNLIRERTKTGLAQVKAAGGRIGREGFGWTRGEALDVEGRRVCEAVAAELAAIDRILGLRSGGATLQQIADTLNVEAVPTKRGGHWYAGTVRTVLMRAGHGHG